jgi:3-oxoacyl-[acyl-carrier protein] reductase
MDFGIQGKTALVCAASKGLGRAIAYALAAEGVNLFLCSRSDIELNELCDQLKLNYKVNADFYACNLTDYDDRLKLIERVKQRYGQLDILVHNVGGPKASSVRSTSYLDWQDGYNRLFASVVQLNEAFLGPMLERQFGRIIAVTSLSVVEPIANLAISNSMRVAVTAMLKSLSEEVAASNITVNCVAPGLISTDRTSDLLEQRTASSGQSQEDYMREYLQSIPARRLGTPEEFAAAVAFLCSKQAAYINGSTIFVDGGKRRSTV